MNKLLSLKKKFRQINYLVISLFSKSVTFTNFLPKKCESEFLKTPLHTAQCGNCRNSLSHFFRKNFVKTMVFLKKLLNSWFDEIFFSEREFLVFHTVHTSTRSPFLRKNCHFPRQIDQINVTNELISRKFFSVIAFHCTFLHYEATSDYFHEKIGKICILTHP